METRELNQSEKNNSVLSEDFLSRALRDRQDLDNIPVKRGEWIWLPDVIDEARLHQRTQARATEPRQFLRTASMDR